ncbi:MAG: winged helix-turn-helix transcriptional regulator [Endomicrobiales bacterium]|nr:winged helix-turn-helix transcriptional regulator [Endomicrobiales bacterium]
MAIMYEKDSEILKAIGHPVRLKMVEGLINNKDCNVNDMVKKMGLPQSTVSQHLGILRSRGIIAPRKDGVRTCYRVVDDRVEELIRVLKK